MKQLLLFIFTVCCSAFAARCCRWRFLRRVRFLSAFLDALTVVAVVISVAVGFYGIYHKSRFGAAGR